MNVYAPNSHQIRFTHKLFCKLSKIKCGSLVICGDFNLTANPHLDLSSKPKRLPLALQPIFHREDVYDTWRCQHAEERDYTFHSLPHNSYSRIDMILVDKVLLQAVFSSTIHDISWSDHAPVSTSIVEGHTPNPAYIWRVNAQVLSSPQNTSIISKHLWEYFQMNLDTVSNPFTVWCAHKAFIRGILIQLCSRIKRQRSSQFEKLLGEIRILESTNKKNPSQSTCATLSKLRTDLRSLLIERHDKYIRALRLTQYSSGNKAGKFLENRFKAKKLQSKI